MDKKYIFLLPFLSQPRCLKRVEMFLDKGYDVEVYGFERNYYQANYERRNFKIHNAGNVDDGKYLSRMAKYLFLVLKLLIKNRKKDYQFYAFGLDFGLILYALRRSYIYEVSDLIYLSFTSNILKKIFTFWDKQVIKYSYKSVFTSEGFLDYLSLSKSKKLHVIENKVDPKLRKVEREPINPEGKIKFGFVGKVRSPKTFMPFMQAISQLNHKYEFHIYGDGPLKDQILSFIKNDNNKNVVYHGPFINPSDLKEIYKNIDISFVCYKGSLNQKYLEPNKLYESILFCKPLLVQKNTFLEERVIDLDTGYSVDASNKKKIKDFLLQLGVSSLLSKSENCIKIDRSKLFNEASEIEMLV